MEAMKFDGREEISYMAFKSRSYQRFENNKPAAPYKNILWQQFTAVGCCLQTKILPLEGYGWKAMEASQIGI